MRFDASPATQRLVYKTVAIDPRMIRCGMVRLGETLGKIKDVRGRVEWTGDATEMLAGEMGGMR